MSLRLRGRVGIGRGEVSGFGDVGDDEAVTASVGEAAGVVMMVGETSTAVLTAFGERERERPRISGSVRTARKLRWVGEDGVVGDEFETDEDDDMVEESWLLPAACEVDFREEAEDGLVVVARPVFDLANVADDRDIERFLVSTVQGQFPGNWKYGMPAWLMCAFWKASRVENAALQRIDSLNRSQKNQPGIASTECHCGWGIRHRASAIAHLGSLAFELKWGETISVR